MAELRQVEAELETVRQAHYAAGDELHGAQGLLAEAALEVSRLEERIRYVVEGRQRARAAPGRAAGAGRAVGSSASSDAQDELEAIAEQIAAAEEQGELLAAQAEEQAQQLPALEDAVRAAQARSNEQRNAGGRRCSSRSRCWRPRAATSTSSRAAAQRAASGWPPSARAWPRPTWRGWPTLKRQSGEADAGAGRRRGAAARTERRRCRRSTSSAAQQQAAANREAGKQADISARLDALRALQEKVQTEGKLKPWLARHGLDGLQGLWTQVHIEPGWETALEAALRERLNALEVGRLETVRAFAADAPPAKLAFYTAAASGAVAPTRTRRCRACRDLLRLGDAGLKALLNDWLEGVYTAAEPRRGAGQRAAS